MPDNLQIHFLGASGTVTGSKFLLKLPDVTILVDCGLFQGIKKLRELNWQQLPVQASDIDIVLLTHGHLDHTGFLPRLVNMGFRGTVWGTAPTLEIAEIILRDSAKIQEEDAERANKGGYTKHKPALPLYNTKDVEKTVRLFSKIVEDEWITIHKSMKVRFLYNGHIIGATFIELDVAGKRIVFSGDIGRNNDPLLRDPKKPEKADFLFLESTYGGRYHTNENIAAKLEQVINETIQLNGTLIIPSFAVERAQLLMYFIWQLYRQNKIPRSLPVFLDSPMGAAALDIFKRYHEWHKLSEKDCNQMTERIRVVESFRETWEIIDLPGPKVIIAGSGMVTGGRVLTYLQQYIGKPETTVLLAGYQAEGTRGRQLLDGAEEIKFFGKYFPVKARIDMLQGLSGHADQSELIEWISNIDKPPQETYLIHGESHASDILRVKLNDLPGWNAVTPELFEIREINLGSVP